MTGIELFIHPSAAIIGTLMILTPGVAMTMGIRDLLRADYLSGIFTFALESDIVLDKGNGAFSALVPYCLFLEDMGYGEFRLLQRQVWPAGGNAGAHAGSCVLFRRRLL
jgi:hypothetical protein